MIKEPHQLALAPLHVLGRLLFRPSAERGLGYKTLNYGNLVTLVPYTAYSN
jgi:hypothetical protein